MTRKELRERLYRCWRYGKGMAQPSLRLINMEVWQERPNTAVRVSVLSQHVGYGFTKVRYPDVWDEQRGAELAVKKAIASIVKSLLDSECASIEAVLCQPTK